MGKLFIDQVRAIVLSNLSDEKFGAPELASELGLSSSQTLRKVKAATTKSANQYIRELRLEKAAKLIKKTDDSIAEISYQVGFSSPSYFNKAFSKYYGIAPGEYKAKSSSLDELTTKTADTSPRESVINKKIIFAAIAIILVCVLGFIGVNQSTSKASALTNSIAVLPFKDLSPEDTQWFSDGMSDNILHALAQMQDVSVTSFTSSSTYRDSEKQIPEIAKELGVSYILEGSVTLHNNRIKIIAQLIDANDKHVWSKEYNGPFDNVIDIQNNVAQEVMQQLKKSLSVEEQTILKKYPTENMEAYNFHLKGRLVNETRNYDDLVFHIEMNKKAIALDSSFAQAYAEIAKSYLLLQKRHFETVDIFNCRDNALYYANKAAEIDPKNVLAWVAKSMLAFHKDWDQAETYIDKAIALNTNDAYARMIRGVYYEMRSIKDIKKALEEYRIAYRLNPLSTVASGNLLSKFIVNNQIEAAELHLKTTKFLYPEYYYNGYNKRIIGVKNRDWTSVLPFSKSIIKADPENALNYIALAEDYSQILNDYKSAISYAKKGYAVDSTYIAAYVHFLILGKKFNDASNIMQSEVYKSILEKPNQLNQLYYYYNSQGNYAKALEILKDNQFKNDYIRHVDTYAKMGNRKKVDSMNKRHPWGNGRSTDWNINRASIHAVLKDTDSMYFYLEQLDYAQALVINGFRTIDPYRNEVRYKAFLRINYLPVLSE